MGRSNNAGADEEGEASMERLKVVLRIRKTRAQCHQAASASFIALFVAVRGTRTRALTDYGSCTNRQQAEIILSGGVTILPVATRNFVTYHTDSIWYLDMILYFSPLDQYETMELKYTLLV